MTDLCETEQGQAVRTPRLVEGVESRRTMGGTLLARPDGARHLLIADEELPVIDSLDGATERDELVTRFGPVAADLVTDLELAGFLVGVPGDEDGAIEVSIAGMEFAGFDRFISVVGRCGGHVLVSWPGALVMGVVSLLGVVVLNLTRSWPDNGLSNPGAVVAVWCLVLAHLPAALVHESAHALVLDRHGRRVGRAGFGFYWGGLSFFVDATDALMLGRRARLTQTLAGPAADLLVAGCLAAAAWCVGPTDLGMLLRVLAVVAYIEAAINLLPLLQLDGYWFLSDALDEPDLRRRSLSALVRFRSATGRSDRLLAGYAACSVVAGAALISVGIAIWINDLGPLVLQAFTTSWCGAVGAVLMVLPLALGGAAQLVHLAVGGLHGDHRPERPEGGE